MKKRNYRTYVEYNDGRIYAFESMREAMSSTITMELHVAGSGCTIREALELIRDYIPQIENVMLTDIRMPERHRTYEYIYYNGKIDEEVLNYIA